MDLNIFLIHQLNQLQAQYKMSALKKRKLEPNCTEKELNSFGSSNTECLNEPKHLQLINIELIGFKSYRQREFIGPFDKKFTW